MTNNTSATTNQSPAIPNTDPATGIRYGVINSNSLESWVLDEIMYNGENLTYKDALEQHLTDAEAALEPLGVEWSGDLSDVIEDQFAQAYYEENDTYLAVVDGVRLLLRESTVTVLASHVTAQVSECSPCYPDAGDLDSPNEYGVTAYTVPFDWFAENN